MRQILKVLLLTVMLTSTVGFSQTEFESTKALAEQGDALGQSRLGVMYYNGEGVPQNKAEALKWFRLAAEQGDARGQSNLGVMYSHGEGVPQNKAEALKWFRLAAEQGYAGAQSNLGVMYRNGEGVPQNDTEGHKWYQLAAAQGYAQAQYELGVMYANGEGVLQHEPVAVMWYRLAAEQGHALAQNNLGSMYSNGNGVPQNKAEALKWFRLAAEQGEVLAQLNLGVMYAIGEGVPQNHAESLKWYRLAAEQGHALAQNNLGSMYALGHGIPQNNLMAYVWFSVAVAQGRELAREGRERTARLLTPEQLTRGQEIAARCFESGYKDCAGTVSLVVSSPVLSAPPVTPQVDEEAQAPQLQGESRISADLATYEFDNTIESLGRNISVHFVNGQILKSVRDEDSGFDNLHLFGNLNSQTFQKLLEAEYITIEAAYPSVENARAALLSISCGGVACYSNFVYLAYLFEETVRIHPVGLNLSYIPNSSFNITNKDKSRAAATLSRS